MTTIVLGLLILASPFTYSDQNSATDNLPLSESRVSGCIGIDIFCEQDSASENTSMSSYVSETIGVSL